MRGYDRSSIEPRLAVIVRELEAIRAELPADVEQYLTDEGLRYQLEHRLLLAVQAALDVSAHIALRRGLLTLGSYREAIERLGDDGVFSAALVNRLVVLPGMSNALVHDYLEVDSRRVYAALRDSEPLEAFVSAVLALLGD